jgi:hypothetical protein
MVRKIGDDGKLTNDGTFYEYLKDIGCPAIRGEYIGGLFLIFLAHIPFFALNSILINAVEFTNNSISKIVLVIIALVLGYLFQGLALLFYFSLISRRLLDMGITAKLWVVAVIPIIGFVFSLVLAFFGSNDRKVTKTTIEKNGEMGILYMVVFFFISPLIYTFSFGISINWAAWTLQSPILFIFVLTVFVLLIIGLLRILGAQFI